MTARWLAWIASALLCGCSEAAPSQVLLHIDTDALLPPPPGVALQADEPLALFDTLRVDVFDAGDSEPCEGCSRTFALDQALVAAGEASIGIAANPDEARRVRLRLYASDASLDGALPEHPDGGPPASVIDLVAELPPAGDEGAVSASAVLFTANVGLPQGSLEDPIRLHASPPVASVVGSWSGAQRVDCALPPPAGRVCVPGGAYWMGNPAAVGLGVGDAADQRRLVVMHPFYIDATEVTVEAYREAVNANPELTPELSTNAIGPNAGNAWRDYCTFTTAPGNHEQQPVVCVDWQDARSYCQIHGGDLPSEAQLEYVASGLRGRRFVWGSDLPACDDAVLARYGFGLFAIDNEDFSCTPLVPPGGVELVGSVSARRDRLELAGGVVYDLVGNASEWTVDDWNRQDEACWSGGGVYVDPRCQGASPKDGPLHTYRLGSYTVGARQAMAATRFALVGEPGINGIDLGFRCVSPGE
jgi:formylglycine-generating enzyme required for sulfatase activity